MHDRFKVLSIGMPRPWSYDTHFPLTRPSSIRLINIPEGKPPRYSIEFKIGIDVSTYTVMVYDIISEMKNDPSVCTWDANGNWCIDVEKLGKYYFSRHVIEEAKEGGLAKTKLVIKKNLF
jgi:hypothetical protein